VATEEQVSHYLTNYSDHSSTAFAPLPLCTDRHGLPYDPGQVAREQIEAAMDEEGYPVQR
jgi:hypothetical protein